MEEPKLDVLTCPNCGAGVPFGDGDTATCTHCRAKVPVPPAYRELREAAHADEDARREAEHVLQTLDDPPWLVTRVVAVALDLPMLAFLFFYGIPGGLFAILYGIDLASWLARRLGYASGDDTPAALTMVMVMLLLLLITFVPRALGVYANRRATSRVGILAALAARPPKTPDGPSECRTCGAPLFVTEGVVLARCIYCGSENAVHLQTQIVEGTRSVAKRVLSTTRQAAEADRTERRATRLAMWHELRRYLFRALVFGALFVTYAIDDDRPAVREGSETPGYGIAALCLSVVAFFVFLFHSASMPADDAAERRKGAGLPEWVRYVAPIGVWVLLYVVTEVRAAIVLHGMQR